MAIQLNLYHEVLRSEQQRKRDPLKLSVLALLVLILAMLTHYFLRYGAVQKTQNEAARLAQEWSELEPQATQAVRETAQLSAQVRISDRLVDTIEQRFFWAPLFEQIVRTVPLEVQITDLIGAMRSEKPGTFTLSLKGLAAGEAPRTVAENLRTSLLRKLGEKYQEVTASFQTLEDAPEPVQVRGQALPAALFTIRIQNNTGTPTDPLAPANPDKQP